MRDVFVNLAGGLGNQLFQIAAGYAYSEYFDRELRIDTSKWSGHQGQHPLKYKDNLFKNFTFCGYAFRDYVNWVDPQFNYTPINDSDRNVIFLNGYFQSLKYFEDCADKFKHLLVLPEVDTWITSSKNVAFHIRRGDYLKFKNVHYVCDTEYFDKCFDMFKGYQINVFTDSPEHVLEEFKHQDFNLIQTSSELNDLTLMSLHDNMVISNSTFSWWASFLGKKKERIVSPSKWFADGREATDIFRDEFIRI